jgi:hypothetical protein
MSEDAYYDKVAQELQAQTMVPGVWARAFSESGGQLDRARALYIKHRVAQLASEASEKLRQERRVAAKAAKQRAIAGLRRFIYGLLGIIFGLIAFIFLVVAGSIPFITPLEPTSDMIGGIFGCIVALALFGFLTYVCAKASSR